MTTPPFAGVITDAAQLSGHYRQPNDIVLAKDIDHIDEGAAAFIAASTFVLIGTANAKGEGDVSPKGGEPGFVHVLDEKRLAIPDLNGNNRIDSLRNIVENPHVGMLFLVPERGETLRVNGRAWVSVDDELRNRFAGQYRTPASVIAVEVTDVFIHCAKCIRRAGLWDPESWGSNADAPSSGTIFAGHLGLDPAEGAAVDAGLEASYAEDLAADKPI